jgi:hypothetical protein
MTFPCGGAAQARKSQHLVLYESKKKKYEK